MTNTEQYLKNIRVISITTRLDRRTRINDLLAAHELEYEFSDAVTDDVSPIISCAKSHYKTLDEFYKSATADDEYLLILEDDCEFVEDFEEKFNRLNIKEVSNWDSLCLGCLHVRKPIPISDGLWQATFPLDRHCVLYKVNEIPKYLKIIEDCIEIKGIFDLSIAEQIDKLNILSAYPNLAYQKVGSSDIANLNYSNYHEDGSQKIFLDAIQDI